MIKFINVIFLSLLLFACNQPCPTCQQNQTSKHFKSYLDTLITHLLQAEKSNLQITVLAKYQLKDTLFVTPLPNAIIVLTSSKNQSSVSKLTAKNGKISFTLHPEKYHLLVKYYGYNDFEKDIEIKNNELMKLRIVLGVNN